MAMRTKNGERVFSDALLFHISQFEDEQAQALLTNAKPQELIDSSRQTLLHYTVFYKNTTITKYLIDIGCEVDAQNTLGVTPLMLAVDLMHKPTIEVLLEANADIFVRNHNGESPLQAALGYRSDAHPDIAVMFLDILKRETSNEPETLGKILVEYQCTLHRVMLLNDTAVTRYMLANGYTIHDVDSNNATSLHYAVSYMNLDNVKLLVERGADVNSVNNQQQTPLHFYDFEVEENYAILRFLLDHGASLTVCETDGFMVATSIFKYGGVDMIELVMEYSIDLHAKNSDNSTLIHHLVTNKNIGVLELVDGKNFDVNAMDNDGRAALWYAAEAANQAGMGFLMKNGANPELQDVDKNTAMLYGFFFWVDMKDDKKNCLGCLEMLLGYAVDVQMKGSDNETLFDIALESSDTYLIKPVIAHIAMLKAIGKPVRECILSIISSHDMFAKYFGICQRKIKKLQNTIIYENVTLFKFLVESEERLLRYAQNTESVKRLKCITYRERHSNIYFIKLLRRRVNDILHVAKLREEAIIGLLKIEGLYKNMHVINKIVRSLKREDLRHISLI